MNIFNMTGPSRTGLLVFLYGVTLACTLWLAYMFRFDFNVPPEYLDNFLKAAVWIIPLRLLALYGFRQYAGLLSFFSTPDLMQVLYSTGLASVVISLARLFLASEFMPPRGVIIIEFLLSFVAICSIRFGLRLFRERHIHHNSTGKNVVRRVGIVGAGDAGAKLARELTVKRGLGLHPLAFFDDDNDKWNSRVHNIPVLGPPEMLLNRRVSLNLDEVIIAMPSAPPKRVSELVKLLQQTRLKFETVPSLDQLATGQVRVSQLRNVDIQDLLGREPVILETNNIRSLVKDKVVMVTGAGGSIGSELCRQLASYHPLRLLMVEQSEPHIFQIEQEMIEAGHGGVILSLVADILDEGRLRYIMHRFKPEIIFHAAAHKHVPMMESQPSEAIKNNSCGTLMLAELALEFGVERFIFISTDKAINPTNVMGVSKRLAEILLQSLQASQRGHTRFISVRFGNVLGSSGSVIPIFRKQIAAGGPVKVTHPDVTRYFMTIPEAAGLVLQSATQGEGGEIFVLDMGQPVKIVDLARQMIELSGLKPYEDIEIEFTGLRPGEKLFEELSYQGENYTPTSHAQIKRYVNQPQDWNKLHLQLKALMAEIHRSESNQLKQMLKQIVPEYQPYLT